MRDVGFMTQSRETAGSIVLTEKFRELTPNQAVKWILERGHETEERVVIVDEAGQRRTVMIGYEEFMSLIDYLLESQNQGLQAFFAQRRRELSARASKEITPTTNFFDRSQKKR